MLKQTFPNVATLALTATATEKVNLNKYKILKVKVDIVQNLKMKNCLYL
jgi:superfamily II DNA helicase RecQ